MNDAEIKVLENRMYDLDKQRSKLLDEAVEADPTILRDMDRFSSVGLELKKEIAYIDRTIRLNMEPKFDAIPDYGDRMTLADFIASVKAGAFIDYDGFGRYARDGQESNIEIHPSDVKHDAIRPDFTEIVWYNR